MGNIFSLRISYEDLDVFGMKDHCDWQSYPIKGAEFYDILAMCSKYNISCKGEIF